MVLSHHDIFPVLQPGLGFDYTQEDIILDLSAQAWKLKTSIEQFTQVNWVLEREEERVEIIRGVLVTNEEAMVDREVPRPF